MLVRAHSFEVHHGIAEHVHVELDVRAGLPSFAVIGLAGGAARDARERVRAAVHNSGFAFPRKRVTVNLAPASARRTGAAFDLAIACCVLAAQDELDAVRLARIGLFAELGLGGGLRTCLAVGIAAEAADDAGLAGLIVAAGDLREARRCARLPIAGMRDLRQVATLLHPEAPRGAGTGSRRRADPRPDSPAAEQGASAPVGGGRPGPVSQSRGATDRRSDSPVAGPGQRPAAERLQPRGSPDRRRDPPVAGLGPRPTGKCARSPAPSRRTGVSAERHARPP